MKKYIFYTILLSLACNSKDIDIIGHWHIKRIEGEINPLFEFNSFLDFENDSIVFIGKLDGAFDGIPGKSDKQLNIIKFVDLHRGVDESFNLEYETENKINLVQIDKGKSKQIYQAERCDSDCCDKQIHFFSMIDVDLDLPIKSNEGKYLRRQEKSLEFSIFIGIPKKEYQSKLGNQFRLIFNNKVSSVENLSTSENKFKIKVPDSKESRIRRIIYADKNVPTKTINEIVDYYKSINQKNLFLALRNEDIKKGIIIYLKNIHDFHSQNHQTIGEWLMSHSKNKKQHGTLH